MLSVLGSDLLHVTELLNLITKEKEMLMITKGVTSEVRPLRFSSGGFLSHFLIFNMLLNTYIAVFNSLKSIFHLYFVNKSWCRPYLEHTWA